MTFNLNDFLGAIRQVESGGNPYARGADGEYGLNQLLPSTAAQYDPRIKDNPNPLFNPELNNIIAEKHFKSLLAQNGGDFEKAAYAYNKGQTGLRNAEKSGNFSKVGKDYVQKVLAAVRKGSPGTKDRGVDPANMMPTASPSIPVTKGMPPHRSIGGIVTEELPAIGSPPRLPQILRYGEQKLQKRPPKYGLWDPKTGRF